MVLANPSRICLDTRLWPTLGVMPTSCICICIVTIPDADSLPLNFQFLWCGHASVITSLIFYTLFSFTIHQPHVSSSFCFFCLARCSFRLFPNFRWDALRGIYSDVTLPYLTLQASLSSLRQLFSPLVFYRCLMCCSARAHIHTHTHIHSTLVSTVICLLAAS